MRASSTAKLIGLAILLITFCPAFGDEPEMLGPESWPTTVDQTVQHALSRMAPEDKEVVRNTKKEDLILFHHGWGTSIRNYYGLWRGNKALIDSACGKPCHPDEASMIIIEAIWNKLQK